MQVLFLIKGDEERDGGEGATVGAGDGADEKGAGVVTNSISAKQNEGEEHENDGEGVV